MVHSGLPARILIDAYPQRPLNGTVAEVNAINTPINGSDVRVYYVNVNIDDGFDDLRPGLSAEVSVRVGGRRKVTRVPIERCAGLATRPLSRSAINPSLTRLRKPGNGSRLSLVSATRVSPRSSTG